MRPILVAILMAVTGVFLVAMGSNSVSSPTDLSNTFPLGKFSVVDAGVALINGQLQVKGPVISDVTGSDGLTFTDANSNNRITFGSGQFVKSIVATGHFLSTGGFDGPTVSLSAAGTSNIADSATAPTISNGCTGEAVTWSHGTALFRFDVGSTCAGVSSTVITLPASTNCWSCECHDIVNDATLQEAFAGCTTGSFTVSNRTRLTTVAATYTDGADIQCSCRGG